MILTQNPENQSRDEHISDPYGSSSSSYGSSSAYGQSGSYGQTDAYGQSGQYGQTDPYGQTGAYGQGAPYGAGALPDHPRATTVLVLGILGLFFAPLGVVGLILGQGARKEIRNGAPYQSGGSLQIGWVISLIVTILFVLGLVLVLLLAAFGLFAASTAPTTAAAAAALALV